MNGDYDDILDNDMEDELDEEIPFEDDSEENSEETRIGIIGFDTDGGGDIDEEFIYEELSSIIDNFIEESEMDNNVVIVSNGLNIGISKIAYEIANERGYKTIAIYTKFSNNNNEMYAVDMSIEVDHTSDDDIFVDYIDALVVVGKSSTGDTDNKLQLAEENDDVSIVEIDL